MRTMKTLSILITILLAFPLVQSIDKVITYYQGYDSLTSFGLTAGKINALARPLFISSLIFLVGFMLSIILTVRKKYYANCILLGCYIAFLCINAMLK